MNSKGVLFTVMTFFLVFSLLGLASTFANANLQLKRDANLVTSSDKLGYAFESVRSQMQEATGVDVFKELTNITFNDTIPRQTDLHDFLRQYGDFVDDVYEDPALSVKFVDTSGNVINWELLDDITVKPFNITYVYPNVGKNSLEVRFKNETELAHLERAEIFVKVLNGTIQLVPPPNWAPQQNCSPPGTPPDCLPFRAVVTDGLLSWDSGERNFKLDKQSAVQVNVVGGGFVRITVGRAGAGDDRILQVEISDTSAETSTKVVFDTEDFFVVNDPARLRVFDSLTYLEHDV